MEKDKWINNVMEAGGALPRLAPDDGKLLRGIYAKVRGEDAAVPLRWVWVAAASVALLAVLNMGALRSIKVQHKEPAPASDPYGLYTNNNIY